MGAFPAEQHTESMSDEQLVSLARQNSEEAFMHLVSRCLPMFKRLSRKFRSQQMETEDLVQEGLLSLLGAVRTYRADGAVSFRTYAYACARNRMISALRRGGSGEVVAPEGDEPYDQVGDNGADPAVLLQRREELAALYGRIGSVLTPVEYQVLRLYLASYSYREIARRLNIETKAVDNALQRLRRKLANAAVF
ncbi:MAG: sigma-70 family RNA polymerase sigma factor [Clostridia bacterium]|nr:sigma-70 family RNA polymerase sigma factor [Clostridia bacterium]